MEPGRRERKKRETSRSLAEAARTLAGARGGDAVTVEEIASAVDVSTRTFFNHWSCKDEAIAAAMWPQPEAVRAALLDRPTGETPLEAVLATMSALLAPRDAEELRVLQAVLAGSPGLLAHWLAASERTEDVLVDALAERTGADPDDLLPRLVCHTAGAAFRVALQRWSAAGGREPLSRTVSEVTAALARGLAPEGPAA